jgi:hypothetical protein
MVSSEGIEFDNIYAMQSQKAIAFIKKIFSEELKIFSLEDEYNKSTGYWGIKYTFKDSTIFLRSDRGLIELDIVKDKSKINLKELDNRIGFAKISSEKNIHFILEMIKNIFLL